MHIHPERVSTRDVDFSWMGGRVITEVRFSEPSSWWFSFGREAWIMVDCSWRIIDQSRLACCGEDHGHQFGLPAPFDAATDAMRLLSAHAVSAVQLRDGTADIVIEISLNLRLEILPNSRGYESWQVSDPFGTSYVAADGQISRWKH